MPGTEERQRAEGVLTRADNGDMVTFDETGLTLRLSETVLDDPRAWLWLTPDVVEVPGDLDAWDPPRDGPWFPFTADLDGAGARGYRRRAEGGDIIAWTPGGPG